jgi:hypothetical protein
MNGRTATILSLLASCISGDAFAARNSADLQPPQVRELSVVNALRLWQRKLPPSLPTDFVSPFSPPDFDKPESADLPSNSTAGTPSSGESRKSEVFSVVQRSVPLGERQLLERLAAQIAPTGMILLRGSPRLVISNKPFEVGTRFTATYNNQDYELELVAIDRTTFTLRYRSEEIIRPIKPVR